MTSSCIRRDALAKPVDGAVRKVLANQGPNRARHRTRSHRAACESVCDMSGSDSVRVAADQQRNRVREEVPLPPQLSSLPRHRELPRPTAFAQHALEELAQIPVKVDLGAVS